MNKKTVLMFAIMFLISIAVDIHSENSKYLIFVIFWGVMLFISYAGYQYEKSIK
jgi:hypothetical protein